MATQIGIGLQSLEFSRGTETFRGEYDQDEVAPSTAIVGALSELRGLDPTDMVPLYESVDAEALDDLVGVRDPANGTVRVSFTVGDYEVTAVSGGVIEIGSTTKERELGTNA